MPYPDSSQVMKDKNYGLMGKSETQENSKEHKD